LNFHPLTAFFTLYSTAPVEFTLALFSDGDRFCIVPSSAAHDVTTICT